MNAAICTPTTSIPGQGQDEMSRIHKYMVNLQDKVRKECDNFSEDVKYLAEYKTDIKEFLPWLTAVEADSTNGLAKPSSLQEATALSEKVHKYEAACAGNLKVLEAANAAAIKMTTHKVSKYQLSFFASSDHLFLCPGL